MKKLKDALENIYMFYNGEDIRSAIWDHDDYDVINEAIVYGDGGDCAGGPLFTLGQLWPSGIVIACVCLCVCVCVCVSVNHQFARTITCHPLKLQSPKLDQKCKTPWLRSLLFLGFTDIDLQGQIELKSKNFTPFWACEFVRAIRQYQMKWGFPNLDQKCILALLRPLLILGLIDHDLQFHF